MDVTDPQVIELPIAERRLLAARLEFRKAAAEHERARDELIAADLTVRRLAAPAAPTDRAPAARAG